MIHKEQRLKVSFNSPVILTFTFLCFASLILGALTHGLTTRLFFSVYRSSPVRPLTYLRMIGHVFGHAGWEHFFNNITLILVVGPMLEEKYGPGPILMVIFATAIITGTVHVLLFPNTMLLGASGVVFAFILLASFTNFREGYVPFTFLLVAAIYIGGQIYSGIFVQDNISNLTHILGGGVGSGLGFLMGKNKIGRYVD